MLKIVFLLFLLVSAAFTSVNADSCNFHGHTLTGSQLGDCRNPTLIVDNAEVVISDITDAEPDLLSLTLTNVTSGSSITIARIENDELFLQLIFMKSSISQISIINSTIETLSLTNIFALRALDLYDTRISAYTSPQTSVPSIKVSFPSKTLIDQVMEFNFLSCYNFIINNMYFLDDFIEFENQPIILSMDSCHLEGILQYQATVAGSNQFLNIENTLISNTNWGFAGNRIISVYNTRLVDVYFNESVALSTMSNVTLQRLHCYDYCFRYDQADVLLKNVHLMKFGSTTKTPIFMTVGRKMEAFTVFNSTIELSEMAIFIVLEKALGTIKLIDVSIQMSDESSLCRTTGWNHVWTDIDDHNEVIFLMSGTRITTTSMTSIWIAPNIEIMLTMNTPLVIESGDDVTSPMLIANKFVHEGEIEVIGPNRTFICDTVEDRTAADINVAVRGNAVPLIDEEHFSFWSDGEIPHISIIPMLNKTLGVFGEEFSRGYVLNETVVIQIRQLNHGEYYGMLLLSPNWPFYQILSIQRPFCGPGKAYINKKCVMCSANQVQLQFNYTGECVSANSRYAGHQYSIVSSVYIHEDPANQTVEQVFCPNTQCKQDTTVSAGMSGMCYSLLEEDELQYFRYYNTLDSIPQQNGCKTLRCGYRCAECERYRVVGDVKYEVHVDPVRFLCVQCPPMRTLVTAILIQVLFFGLLFYGLRNGHRLPWTRIFRVKDSGMLDYDVWQILMVGLDFGMLVCPSLFSTFSVSWDSLGVETIIQFVSSPYAILTCFLKMDHKRNMSYMIFMFNLVVCILILIPYLAGLLRRAMFRATHNSEVFYRKAVRITCILAYLVFPGVIRVAMPYLFDSLLLVYSSFFDEKSPMRPFYDPFRSSPSGIFAMVLFAMTIVFVIVFRTNAKSLKGIKHGYWFFFLYIALIRGVIEGISIFLNYTGYIMISLAFFCYLILILYKFKPFVKPFLDSLAMYWVILIAYLFIVMNAKQGLYLGSTIVGVMLVFLVVQGCVIYDEHRKYAKIADEEKKSTVENELYAINNNSIDF
ncbi:hypothetical protein PCE1_002639 [Barthelona sp. PCE]